MEILKTARKNYFKYFCNKTSSTNEHHLFVSDFHVDFQTKRGFGWPIPYVDDSILDVLVGWLKLTGNEHLVDEAIRTFPR